MMSTLHMETTKIPPEKTAQEICLLLARSGASQVVTEYADREIVGLRWALEINSQTVPFSMPVRIDPVFQIFQRRRKDCWAREDHEDADWAKAKRVAWRQLLRWVQAQLAMIDTGMVVAEEVFMPYIEIRPGQTMFDQLTETRFKALPAPRK